MSRNRVIAILAATFLVAGAVSAQTAQAPGRGIVDAEAAAPAGPKVPCPRPIAITLKAPPSVAPALDPADFTGSLGTAVAGSVWNQTTADKGFGYSFHFPFPGKECCLMTRAKLIVHVKALQAGGAGSASSANDWVQIVKNGASVPGFAQQPFAAGATLNQTATVTFNNIPANLLSNGVLSFYVQDDTAVVSAELRLEGCCLR